MWTSFGIAVGASHATFRCLLLLMLLIWCLLLELKFGGVDCIVLGFLLAATTGAWFSQHFIISFPLIAPKH